MTLSTYKELADELHARMTRFAPGQQRIADLILRDPEGTAFRTIGETARLADVNQSSIVRFAQLLELKGYPALVALCREYLAGQANLVTRFDAAQRASAGDLFTSVLEHERENLNRTYARIDQPMWDAVVQALSHAPRIHVLGLRKCTSVAQLLAYLLRLIRPGVHQLAPLEGGLADELRDLNEGDVFIAISIRRYTANTVKAMRHARGRGLVTIALTDDNSSPLAELADHAFLIETNGVTVLRSLTVFTSLCQTLATAVAIESGAKSRSELQVDEQLLEELSVYEF